MLLTLSGLVAISVDVARASHANAALPEVAPTQYFSAQTRILDTRTDTDPDTGQIRSLIGQSWRRVKVAPMPGLPAAGAFTAVQVAITAINPSSSGYINAAADDATPSTSVSYLNYSAATITTNSSVVPVSSNGYLKIYASNQVHVTLDVQGYFAQGATGASFVSLNPSRAYDSRNSSASAITQGETRSIPIVGFAGVPSGAVAVAVNLAVVGPSSNGSLKVYPAGGTVPIGALAYSSANVTSIGTMVGLSASGSIAVTMMQGSADVVIDVVGYYVHNGIGGFVPISGRAFDTRTGPNSQNPQMSAIPANSSETFVVSGAGTVPVDGVTAVVLHFAVVPSGQSGYINVWQPGLSEPNTSTLRYAAAGTTSNLAIVQVDQNGAIKVANHGSASIHLIADTEGYFSYGIDADRLSDLQAFAIDEGLTLQEVVDQYWWQDLYLSDLNAVREAFPSTFADSNMNRTDGTKSISLRFKGIVPSNVGSYFSDLPSDIQRSYAGNAPFSEEEEAAVVEAAMDSLAQDGASDIVAAYNPDLDRIEASAYVQNASYSEAQIGARAKNAVSSSAPGSSPATPVDVLVTYMDGPPSVLTSGNCAGGTSQENPVPFIGGVRTCGQTRYGDGEVGSCTTGFAAIRPSDGVGGMLFADHCGNQSVYKPGDMSIDQGFANPSHRGNSKYGDVEFSATVSCITPANPYHECLASPMFHATPNYIRTVYDVQPMERGSVYCWFGTTTNQRKCGKVRGRTSAQQLYVIDGQVKKVRYSNLVGVANRQYAQAVDGGDSGGPVFSGSAAVGLIEGVVCGIHKCVSNPLTGKVECSQDPCRWYTLVSPVMPLERGKLDMPERIYRAYQA